MPGFIANRMTFVALECDSYPDKSHLGYSILDLIMVETL
jgi:hypothetical protein